jgi:hypothetical protein
MSSVAEMSALVREAADHTAMSSNWKDRVDAAARVLRLSFGRTKRHYFGEARRVDAEEMDRARAAIEELREQELRRQAADHLAWLNSTVERLRQTDEEFYGFDVAGFERAVSRLGPPGSAVGGARAAAEVTD